MNTETHSNYITISPLVNQLILKAVMVYHRIPHNIVNLVWTNFSQLVINIHKNLRPKPMNVSIWQIYVVVFIKTFVTKINTPHLPDSNNSV